MSQESDAVVIVVSEQTGDISIANRGVLTRRLSQDQLRNMLTNLLGRGQNRKVMKAAAMF
jgi:diadenylate cyclase